MPGQQEEEEVVGYTFPVKRRRVICYKTMSSLDTPFFLLHSRRYLSEGIYNIRKNADAKEWNGII